MRRTILTFLATVSGLGLILGLKTLQPAATVHATDSPTTSTSDSPTSTTAVSGTFTGDEIQTEYGPVQVEVTIVDGKITAVDALKTPSGNPRNEQIAAHAVPILTAAVLDAQSANVDSVSGATYTSDGYLRSLQSALDQANA
jgi:uncharacterized protein with FMN-binding domain